MNSLASARESTHVLENQHTSWRINTRLGEPLQRMARVNSSTGTRSTDVHKSSCVGTRRTPIENSASIKARTRSVETPTYTPHSTCHLLHTPAAQYQRVKRLKLLDSPPVAVNKGNQRSRGPPLPIQTDWTGEVSGKAIFLCNHS